MTTINRMKFWNARTFLNVTRRVDALKKEGRKSALLLVSNAQGEVRFVAISIE